MLDEKHLDTLETMYCHALHLYDLKRVSEAERVLKKCWNPGLEFLGIQYSSSQIQGKDFTSIRSFSRVGEANLGCCSVLLSERSS